MGEGAQETDRELRERIERLRVELREALNEWDRREAEHQTPEERRYGFKLLKGLSAVALMAPLVGLLRRHRPEVALGAVLGVLAVALGPSILSVEPEPWIAAPTPQAPVVAAVPPDAIPPLPPVQVPPDDDQEADEPSGEPVTTSATQDQNGAEEAAGAEGVQVQETVEPPAPAGGGREAEEPEPKPEPRKKPPNDGGEEPEPEPPEEPEETDEVCVDLDLRPVADLSVCIEELLEASP